MAITKHNEMYKDYLEADYKKVLFLKSHKTIYEKHIVYKG